MKRIVEENISHCIGFACSGLNPIRFYVIDEPINQTGICKEFPTREAAQVYIESLDGTELIELNA